MRHYRSQPQAASHVYRSVLLKPVSAGQELASTAGNEPAKPQSPSKMAETSTVGTDGVERGDLIKFYNTGLLVQMGIKMSAT